MLLQRTSDTSKINRRIKLGNAGWFWCRTLIVLIAWSCVGCAVVSSGTTELVGKPVPWSRLMLFDGTQVPLTPDAGNIHVVLFWASWCPRSRYVVEDYEQLARNLGGHERLSFFAVSIDRNEDFEKLKGRIDSQGLHSIKHCFSGNDVQDEAFLHFNGHTIPFVVVIDSQGIVRVVTPHVDQAEDFLNSKGYEAVR